ncbi:4Fe-4S dicluster domain-containing protein [Sutterella sp.]|uniref:4Fe-4S dicluster domain-containing protein n=1 Tax=Sutterella sp. TaxID=1981025 RepID=UPI0026DFEAB7|nr:4Fe-4S dicluster domain-containing protein [Sutterella sp.]MDO5532845.1 4Fe-4S dicluster domain-containing protein [Sutterella sp.]
MTTPGTESAPVQFAHLWDGSRCIRCSACIVACAQTNFPELLNTENAGWETLPANTRWETLFEDGPDAPKILVQCQECGEAACIAACPYRCNYRDEKTGLVKIDPTACVGCGLCVTMCPYDLRWMHPVTRRPVKCMGEGCEKRLAAGLEPACVAICSTGARAFGNSADPASDFSERLRRSGAERLLPEEGTEPNFYVVMP